MRKKFQKTQNLLFFLLVFLLSSSKIFAQVSIPITTDSRIKTLVYNPNEVFELKFYYGYQSFIEFAENEEIEMISIGEAFAWKITPAEKRLFIRPLEIAAHTNMTIITNKRTYHFDIKSDEYDGRADEELVYTVRFYYPQLGEKLPIPPQIASPIPPKLPPAPPPSAAAYQTSAGPSAPISPVALPSVKETKYKEVRRPVPSASIDADIKSPEIQALYGNPEGRELNFDYSMAGRAEPIMPLKVYDNQVETFFQFIDNNKNIPTISVVDAFGRETILPHIVENNYVVLPTVGRQFTLRQNGQLICVYNNQVAKK